MPSRMTRSRQISPTSAKVKYFEFSGGLNLVDAALSLKPGECVAATNFECDIRGRYRRVDGYERYDGQTLPSEVIYYRVPFTVGTSSFTSFSTAFGESFNLQIPTIGTLVVGSASGAIGRVLLVDVTDLDADADEGFFPDGDAEGYIYFTLESGSFNASESIYFLNPNSAFGTSFNVEYK